MKSDTYNRATLNKFAYDNVNREYLVYVPSSYSKKSEAPIVLNFHGFGGTAAGQLYYSDWRELADKHGLILIYPQGLELKAGGSHWNPAPVKSGGKSDINDLGFIRALIKRISREYSVDSTRVYATGYSNGAGMAYGLAHHESDLIAGIAPVSGLMSSRNLKFTSKISPVGVISFNGNNDLVRPASGIKGYLASVTDTSRYWAEVNNSNKTKVKRYKQTSGDFVEVVSYTRKDKSATVEQYLVEGGGHDWLEIDIKDRNLNQLAWKFLSRLRKEDEDIVIARDDSSNILLPDVFKRRFADKISNFNPANDTLEIDTGSFGIDGFPAFAAGKTKKAVKKQLAKQDFDFLYHQNKGGLYFNENGADKGFGDGGIIAILKGAPDLTTSNLVFI